MNIKPLFPEVNNVKVHLKLPDNSSRKLLYDKLNETNAVRHNNYYIVREEKAKTVYSIFPKSGFVNITGVRNFDEVENALAAFNKKFKQNIPLDQLKIDNSTASARITDAKSSNDVQINLEHVKYLIDNETSFSILKATLSPANFPGIVIRSKTSPTCLIFTSGRFNVVGAKGKQDLSNTYQWLCAIIEKYTKMPQTVMSIV